MDIKLAYETITQIVNHLKYDQPSLLQLNRTCRKLYTLSCPLLYNFPQFNKASSFENFALTLTEENGKYVQSVDLHMVPNRWNSTKTYELVLKITEKTPNLQLLNLDLCLSLKNKTLGKITKPLGDLRILSVNQCESIGDDGVEEVIKNCPYIQELYLGETRITDTSLNSLATKLVLLTHLHIPGCENVTEIGINKVIRECRTLRHLDCRDCFNVVGQLERIQGDHEEEEEEGVVQVLGGEEEDEWTDLEDDSDDEREVP